MDGFLMAELQINHFHHYIARSLIIWYIFAISEARVWAFGNWLWFFLRRLSSLFSLKSSPEVKTTHIDPLSLFINSPSVVEFLQFSKLNLFIGNDRVCAFKCSKAWLLRWNNTLIEWTFICWMALKDFPGAPKMFPRCTNTFPRCTNTLPRCTKKEEF